MARGLDRVAALLTGLSVLALAVVVVLDRTPSSTPSALLYSDPAYISWLGGLETEAGQPHEFSSQLTPTSITEMPLGYYRPEVRCNRAPCSEGDFAPPPREPANYEEYMEMRHAQLERAKARAKAEDKGEEAFEVGGGPDNHPFDLPTYPGMQDEVRKMMGSPEQCPPCEGGRRRLLSGCGCA